MTGQYPRRRETDEQARMRRDRLHARAQARQDASKKLSDLQVRMMPKPRISSAGRLVYD